MMDSNMTVKAERKATRAASAAIYQLTTGRYFETLPVVEIKEILNAHGLNGDAMDGIYCGREGRIHEPIGAVCAITMTWFRMETTGRYEIVAYAN